MLGLGSTRNRKEHGRKGKVHLLNLIQLVYFENYDLGYIDKKSQMRRITGWLGRLRRTLKPAVVLRESRVQNPPPLRYLNYLIRHPRCHVPMVHFPIVQ